jgi:hypothetical protein
MSTNKSPLYLPCLLIFCVSDDIVVTSQVYNFHSHIVVRSQSINKNLGLPPPLALFTNTQMPNLIKTTLTLAYFYSASLKKKESLITLELGKGGNSSMFSFLKSSHHHFKVKPWISNF